MEIYSLEIPEVKVIKPKKNLDNRGYFSEVYSNKSMKENGVDLNFLQDNQSLSVDINVVRGLHYQAEPFAQDKLGNMYIYYLLNRYCLGILALNA